TSFAAVQSYLDMGGRIFTSASMYAWYKYSPSAEMRASASIPGGGKLAVGQILLDTSFPKGKALADWLAAMRPSAPYGELKMDGVYDDYDSVDPTASQVWGVSQALERVPAGKRPRIVTTNTPVGKPTERQCGKAVHFDAVAPTGFVD